MEPTPDYHALPSTFISQSALKTFIKSPLEYKHCFVDGNSSWATTPNMVTGSLVHCMLLEPQLVEQQYYVYNEQYRPEPDKTMASTLNKQWKATMGAYAVAAGQEIVSQAAMDQAQAMLQTLGDHELACGLLFGAAEWEVNELAIFWQNPCSDLSLKSKLDRLLVNTKDATATVVDYKTTSASNSTEFGWSVKKYGYDVQAAFYEDAARAYLEVNYPGITFDVTVLFIPQRSTAPYQVLGVLQLDQQTLNAARDRYENALQELEGCLHTGIWETSAGIETLMLSKPLDGIFLPDTELIM